ncbi:MAG: DUF58 domain-containing protein [Gammaproteobacteria bacterium]|jgi:uncharacterized protein (DUF58 family)
MIEDPRIHVSLAQLRSFDAAARNLSFLPRQPANSVLNGQHASRLRGRGLNFEEMRNYLPGDDVRSIDWKATARTGSAHVRVYTEERDRPAVLVVDQRMSMYFGSVLNMKSVSAAEAAAIAAFRVLRVGDRIGGIVFNDDEQIEFAPKRSQRALFAMLQAIVAMNGALDANRAVDPQPGRLNDVLRAVSHLVGHDHLVVVLSDFSGIDDTTHRRLTSLAVHNDVILVLVYDPVAENLRRGESVVVGDTRRQADIDLGATATVEAVNEYSHGRLRRIYDWQREINLSVLPLSAGEATLPQIRRLLGGFAPPRRSRR